MRIPLTHRETEVLALAARGLTNDDIAAQLDISRRTVEAHMRTLFRKTGVHRRSELATLPAEGDLDPPTDQGEHDPGAQRRLDLYAAAVHRLVDRQFALFTERVEIEVSVGAADGADTVVERHWTTPQPYLLYRVIRPLVARGEGPPPDPDELQLTCTVSGQDVGVDINPVLDADGRPLMLILFQPGLSAETEWTLRYRAPQLWDPLRRTGTDTLSWAPATLDQRHQPTLDDLTFRYAFPAGWEGVQVVERDGLGTVRVSRPDTGQTVLTWHHAAPLAPVYRWTVHGGPP